MVHICNSCKCNYFNCHGQKMYLGIYWTDEAIANFCEVKIVPLLSNEIRKEILFFAHFSCKNFRFFFRKYLLI